MITEKQQIEKLADEYANQFMDGRDHFYGFKAGFEKAESILISKKTGIELIAIERQEQIEKHGYTVMQDVANNSLPTGPFKMLPFKIVVGNLMGIVGGLPYPENWSEEAIEKMKAKTELEKLVIAGAFIAAEIDRLNYKQSKIPKQ